MKGVPTSPSSGEQRWSINGRMIAGKMWGHAAGKPTFALHGWLDNAATFDRLCPNLAGLHVCALDFAGHGYSDARTSQRASHPFEHATDVLAVADELNWTRFSIVGHSMGANIGLYLAALVPERIARCVFIDAFGETGVAEQEQVKRCIDALSNQLNPSKRATQVYPSVGIMSLTRAAVSRIDVQAALNICQRGARQVQGGYIWTFAAAEEAAVAFAFPEPLICSLITQCTAPVCVFAPDGGELRRRWKTIEQRFRFHKNLRLETLQGGHYIHLDSHSNKVGALVRNFIQAHD